MSRRPDDELDVLFDDPGLRALAHRLSQVRSPEPPLDPAFRSSLRRELMQQAWTMAEPRLPWWRRLTSPTRVAWAGVAVGVVLIATATLYGTGQPPRTPSVAVVTYNVEAAKTVSVSQPITLRFSQPMDQRSVERSLSVEPATQLKPAWNDGTVLTLTPTSGALAPNTQYQIKLSGARTADQKPIPDPQPLIFNTQGPAPAPVASPTPAPLLPQISDRHTLPLSTASSAFSWSPDGSKIFYTDASGQVMTAQLPGTVAQPLAGTSGAGLVATSSDGSLVALAGGSTVSLVAGGQLLPLSGPQLPAGPILGLGWQSAATASPSPSPALQLLPIPSPIPAASPVLGGRLVVVTSSRVWTATVAPETGTTSNVKTFNLAAPASGPVQIAPTGARMLYVATDGGVHLVDLASGNDQLSSLPAGPLAWKPDGSQVVYATAAGIVMAEPLGQSSRTIVPLSQLGIGKPEGLNLAWSLKDDILVGGGSSLWMLHRDGKDLHALLPSGSKLGAMGWSSGGDYFLLRTDQGLVLDHLVKGPAVLADTTPVVTSFLEARVKKDQAAALASLDDSGRADYQGGGLSLIMTGELSLHRAYIVFQETTGDGQRALCIARLVLSRQVTKDVSQDVSQFDETLLLVRDPQSGKMLIDHASAGPRTALGSGPSVLTVQARAGEIEITFDSDLDPATVAGAVSIKDKTSGQAVSGKAAYAGNRIVKLTLPSEGLAAGDPYVLVIFTTLKDIKGQPLASEYSVDLTRP